MSPPLLHRLQNDSAINPEPLQSISGCCAFLKDVANRFFLRFAKCANVHH
ncbi:hypothetical protein ES288_D03G160600v1 [Gossypium darwinii]|uniref:Uncharacterized protein n=1 Tax=Gossypium darwinii TaxID=34276 RepID=A0A5D2D7F8_GOSDA|nr:hypothetical protein ES288_D03G160600v1 [Gossypium darwinii]